MIPSTKMPWRYPVGWFAALLSLYASQMNQRGESMAAFMNPGYLVVTLVAIGLVGYGLAYLNWRIVRRRKS